MANSKTRPYSDQNEYSGSPPSFSSDSIKRRKVYQDWSHPPKTVSISDFDVIVPSIRAAEIVSENSGGQEDFESSSDPGQNGHAVDDGQVDIESRSGLGQGQNGHDIDDGQEEDQFNFDSMLPFLIDNAVSFDKGNQEDTNAYFDFQEETHEFRFSAEVTADDQVEEPHSDTSVPVRRLVAWTIFPMGCPSQHASLYDWLDPEQKLVVCVRGFARPMYMGDGDVYQVEDAEETLLVTYLSTTPIVDIDVEYCGEDVVLWVRTGCAWYLLDQIRSDHLSFDGQWLLAHYMSAFLHNVITEDHAQGLRGTMCRKLADVGSLFTPPSFLMENEGIAAVWDTYKDIAFEEDLFLESVADNLETFHNVTTFSFSHAISKKLGIKPPRGAAKARVQNKDSNREKRRICASAVARPSALTPMVDAIRRELLVFQENVEQYGDPANFVYAPGPSPLRPVSDPDAPLDVGDIIKLEKSVYVVFDMISASRAHLIKLVNATETFLGAFGNREHMYVVPECVTRHIKGGVRLENAVVHGMFTGHSFVTFDVKDDCPKCGLLTSPLRVQNTIALDDLPLNFTNPLLTASALATGCYDPIQTSELNRVLVRNEWVHDSDYVYFRMEPTALPSIEELTLKFKTFSKAKNEEAFNKKGPKRTTKLKWADDQYLYAIGQVERMWQDVVGPDLDIEDDASDGDSEEHLFVSRAPSSVRLRVSLLGRWDSLYHGTDEDAGTHPRRLFYTSKMVTIRASDVVGTLCVIPLSHTLNDYFAFPNNFVIVGEHPYHDPLKYLSVVLHQPTEKSKGTDPLLLQAFTGTAPIVNPSTAVLHHMNVQIKSLLFERGWSVSVPQLLYAAKSSSTQSGLTDKNKLCKLRALDLFSGCGGLTVGFDRDALATCDTKWAVEMDRGAVESFRTNFSDSTVFLEDANNLLRTAIDAVACGSAIELPDGTVPMPGEVDAIYCGPPCQGFSRMNSSPKCDDHKNTLIPVSLSFVELYRPKVVLIENVTGMLRYRLGGVQKGQHTVEGGFRGGVPRFIVRVLVSLGYQVTWHVAQAGNYGAPQSRRRVLVLATLPHIKLPTWPEPTHHFMLEKDTIVVRDTDHVKLAEPSTQWNQPQVFCDVRSALFPNVTVRDIISDLPPYDWINPNTTMKISREEDMALRADPTIPQVDAVHPDSKRATECGLANPKYAYTPKSDLQRWLRDSRASDWDGLKGHFTCPRTHVSLLEKQALDAPLINYVNKTFRSEVVERVCHIAKYGPFKDHRSLPDELEPWALNVKNPKSAINNYWAGLYGRLDMEGQFRTVVTNPDPMGKNGTLLHPNQNRLMTVRELARAQTFPDWFRYTGNVTDQYRQVGNAVPPILGAAINRSLFTALLHSPLHSESEKHARELLKLPELLPGNTVFP